MTPKPPESQRRRQQQPLWAPHTVTRSSQRRIRRPLLDVIFFQMILASSSNQFLDFSKTDPTRSNFVEKSKQAVVIERKFNNDETVFQELKHNGFQYDMKWRSAGRTEKPSLSHDGCLHSDAMCDRARLRLRSIVVLALRECGVGAQGVLEQMMQGLLIVHLIRLQGGGGGHLRAQRAHHASENKTHTRTNILTQSK
jgi:hypothetical protein